MSLWQEAIQNIASGHFANRLWVTRCSATQSPCNPDSLPPRHFATKMLCQQTFCQICNGRLVCWQKLTIADRAAFLGHQLYFKGMTLQLFRAPVAKILDPGAQYYEHLYACSRTIGGPEEATKVSLSWTKRGQSTTGTKKVFKEESLFLHGTGLYNQ